MAKQTLKKRSPRSAREAPPRGYTPEATRQAVLDSALRLFEKKGFHATSVQEIAAAAGVSKGAFYHHFDSKEDVLRLIHDEFADEQLADTTRLLETVDSPTEQLRETIRASVVSTARYRAHVTVFFQERRFMTDKSFSAIKAKRDQSEARLVGIVERGIRLGEFRADLEPRIVVFSLIGMIVWLHQWFRPGGSFTAEELGDTLADLVLRGVTADSNTD